MVLSQAELAQLRARFIDERQDALSNLGVRLQDKLVNIIVDKFAELFETSGGNLIFNNKNISATAALDTIFDQFLKNEQVKFVIQFVKDINNITDLNVKYYSGFAEQKARFQKSQDKVKELMRLRLGIGNGGTLEKGGFLDNFVKDTTLRAQIKFLVIRAVTNQISQKNLMVDIKNNISGPDGIDGALVRKYKDYVFDVYQQHDRLAGRTFAQDLDLVCFSYSGGLIDTSREFCQDRNGKIFTIWEAEEWINDPKLPMTKEERKLGRVVNYDPLVDAGRWRCRHHINYIPITIALQRRPNIRQQLIDHGFGDHPAVLRALGNA